MSLEENKKKKRPRGVTLLALLLLASLIVGLNTFGSYGPLGLLIPVYIVAAAGLLALKNWGRILTICLIWTNFAFITFYTLNTIGTIAQYGFSQQLSVVVWSLGFTFLLSLFFAIFFTHYLTKPSIKAVFKPVNTLSSSHFSEETKRFCPYCGAKINPKDTYCPSCGKRIRETVSRGRYDESKVSFPDRKTPSMEDILKKDALEAKEAGIVITPITWNTVFDLLKMRKLICMLTALKNRACILLYISSSIGVPNEKVLVKETLLKPMFLYVKAFLEGTYPILYLVLMYNVQNDIAAVRVVADVRDGSFQDFCKAIFNDEHVDIIIKYEGSENPERYYALEYYAPGLASALKKEVLVALNTLKPSVTEKDYTDSIKMLNRKYPSVADGVQLEKAVKLIAVGEAKNRILPYVTLR